MRFAVTEDREIIECEDESEAVWTPGVIAVFREEAHAVAFVEYLEEAES